MQKTGINLVNLISAISNNVGYQIKSQELDFLFRNTIKISSTYLTVRHSDFLNKHRWNECIEDLAHESVSPLFIKNSFGQIGIIHSILSWNNKLENESDVNFFLCRIVWNRTEQTVIKLLKKRDPVFEKIHKTISNTISDSKLKKLSYFGRIYIVNEDCQFIQGKVLTKDELDTFPIDLFITKRHKLFQNLLEFISDQTDFFPAIPLNFLIKKMKSAHCNDFQNSSYSQPNYENNLDLSVIIDKSTEDVLERLKTKYFEKDKIDQITYNNFVSTFSLIKEDLKNGGLSGTLFSYYQLTSSDIGREEYYNSYHNILNYLFNNIKSDIKKYLVNNL